MKRRERVREHLKLMTGRENEAKREIIMKKTNALFSQLAKLSET